MNGHIDHFQGAYRPLFHQVTEDLEYCRAVGAARGDQQQYGCRFFLMDIHDYLSPIPRYFPRVFIRYCWLWSIIATGPEYGKRG
jgi:hypothetical protein